jgi:hypothetical protein
MLRLQAASYRLAKALNVSISSRWTVRLSEVEEQNMTLCVGFPEGGCGFKDENVGCFAPEVWAKHECLNYSINMISTKSGGQCGYTRYAVKCTKKKAG